MNEHQIQDGLCAYLRKEGISYVQARMDKKSGIQEGWPDVTAVHCGRAWLCELKTGSGKLSKKQVECHAQLKKNGNTVVVARSVEEAVESFRVFMGITAIKTTYRPRRERRNEASETDLSGGVEKDLRPLTQRRLGEDSDGSTKIAKSESESNASPAQNLWLANIGNPTFVFSGDPRPGGICRIVRTATPQDIRDLPRR